MAQNTPGHLLYNSKRGYKSFYREGKQHHNLEEGGFKLEEHSVVILDLDVEENCLDDLLGCAVPQQLFKYLCAPQNFLRGHLHLSNQLAECSDSQEHTAPLLTTSSLCTAGTQT